MPLSDHEQRMLDEIESALYAEDPKFASSVRKSAALGGRRPAALVVFLAILGFLLFVGGLVVNYTPSGIPVIALAGFLVLFAAGVLALRGGVGRRGFVRGEPSPSSAGGSKGSRVGGGESYTERMENRFRRRFDS